MSSVKKSKKKQNKLPKIALEEAFIWPTYKSDVDETFPNEFTKNYEKLLDIKNIRVKEMEKNNIKIMVLSSTTSGIQCLNFGIDQVKKAQEINNYIYSQIEGNNNFKAFDALPMRNPKKASQELERCVTKLGMVGALVNGYDIENLGNGKQKIYFYDTPEYDVLWKKFEELDVPLYLHPAVYHSIDESDPHMFDDLFKKYEILSASAWGFSFNLSYHVMRIVLSGVLDRFPKLKIILGHMGECIVFFADRFDHRVSIYKSETKNSSNTIKLPKLSLKQYIKKNFYVTTSGWFDDDTLDFIVKKAGINRVMFSIDYPYENAKLASKWLDNLKIPKINKEKIAWKNAKKILKLKNNY